MISGECSSVKRLEKDGVPEQFREEILYECYKRNQCAPCVLHEEVKI